MSEQLYYVEIRTYEGNQVIKRLGPHPERRAERIDDGLNINLNHDDYYTLIVRDAPGR